MQANFERFLARKTASLRLEGLSWLTYVEFQFREITSQPKDGDSR